jgi:hypothetical protein
MHTIVTTSRAFENTSAIARLAATALAGLRRAFELAGAPYADGALPPL